ncbi:MAG: FAD:protein FMN transferase [Oscillospiraceae bacterium]|nr:FAD:protein FMN transferase [Oscillospiraceae bacterium]
MRRLLYLLLCVISLCSCLPPASPLSETSFLLDTVCTITLYEPRDPALIELCLDRAGELEKILSKTYPGSDIDRLNTANGNPVEVSGDTLTVLREAISYGTMSGGLFDITISPALSLWEFGADSPALPKAGDIEKARQKIDYSLIKIHGSTVSLPPGFALDLGGLAKGYIADEMAKVLRQGGVVSALLDLGGDIVAIGSRPNGTPFRIGIQTPFAERGETSSAVELSDQALATSGIYERSFTLNGKIYHHILDPYTGMPVENNIASATVVAQSAMQADALATISVLTGGDLPREYSDTLRHITISRNGEVADRPATPPSASH